MWAIRSLAFLGTWGVQGAAFCLGTLLFWMLSLSEANDLQGFELQQRNIKRKQKKQTSVPHLKHLGLFNHRKWFSHRSYFSPLPAPVWNHCKPAPNLMGEVVTSGGCVEFYVRTCGQWLVGSSPLAWSHQGKIRPVITRLHVWCLQRNILGFYCTFNAGKHDSCTKIWI